MAFRYKRDNDGKLVFNDKGDPIFTDDSGKDFTLEEVQADWGNRLAEVSREAAGHRKGKADAKAELLLWTELGKTIDEVKDALQKAETIDLSQYTKAEEVQAKIKAATEQFKRDAENAKKGYEARQTEDAKRIAHLEADLHKTLISNAFLGNEFFNDSSKTLMTPDVAEMVFGKYFRVEDAQAVCYPGGIGEDGKPVGEPMYSLKDPGKHAGFDEAVNYLWESYTQKDRYTPSLGGGDHLPGQRGGGGGAQSGTLLNQADSALANRDVRGSIALKTRALREGAFGGQRGGQKSVPAQ